LVKCNAKTFGGRLTETKGFGTRLKREKAWGVCGGVKRMGTRRLGGRKPLCGVIPKQISRKEKKTKLGEHEKKNQGKLKNLGGHSCREVEKPGVVGGALGEKTGWTC